MARSLQDISKMADGTPMGNALASIWLKSHPMPRQQATQTNVSQTTPVQQQTGATQPDIQRQTDVINSLFGKLIRGGTDAMGNPIVSASQTGSGVLGYYAVPAHVREAVGDVGNAIGWDWNSLSGEERNLLARLVGPEMMARQQRAQQAVRSDPKLAALASK